MNKKILIVSIIVLLVISTVAMGSLFTSEVQNTVNFNEGDVSGNNVTTSNITTESSLYYHITMKTGDSS